MNIETGEIKESKDLSAEEKKSDKWKEMRLPLTPYQRKSKKVGRNELCPCGSNRKFKKCCWTGNEK